MIQPIGDSVLRRSWRDPWLWLAVVAFGALLLALSLLRYQAFNIAMLDLGNMAQAIGSLQRGEPLIFTYEQGQLSRLTGHAELIYLPIGLLYALAPDPRTLLVLQALLAVSGAFPAYRLAARQLESALAGRCAALIYLLYPVMQTAVLFDFHGDTLAMPLLLWALEALDRKAWRAMGLWLALALSCKVYVAAPVFGIGLVLWLRGERRVGAVVAGAATLYGVLVFFGLRPLFALQGTGVAGSATNYLSHYFGEFSLLLLTLDQRLISLLVVLGPALMLGWRAPLALFPATPVLLAALISTGPGGAFDYRYHHYALVVPFLVWAVITGAATVRNAYREGRSTRRWQPDLIFNTLIIALCGALFVNTPLNPLFWLAQPGQGFDSAAYGVIARDALKQPFLEQAVPAGAPIAASSFLAPRLTDRSVLYQTRYPDDPGGERLPELLPQVDLVLADALFDWRLLLDEGQLAGGIAYERAEIGIVLRDPAFGLVRSRDGLLAFARDPNPELVLEQTIEPVAGPSLAGPLGQFGPLRLLGISIEPLGGRRFRVIAEWRREGDLDGYDPVVVSQLAEAPNTRQVHLPSFAIEPLATWEQNQAFRETFVVEFPAELPTGSYTWQLGVYDANHPQAYASDPQAQIGPIQTITTIMITSGDPAARTP